MVRITIAAFDQVQDLFRPSIQENSFETEASAKKEDSLRARLIRQDLTNYKKADRRHLKCLASYLNYPQKHDANHSCASAVDMRKTRDRFAGHLIKYIHENALDCRFVTIIPNSWKVDAEDLQSICARKLMQQLRSDLNRVGASRYEGGLVSCLDCEHEPATDSFQFHTHMLVWGSLINAIDRLRTRPKYVTAPNALRHGIGAVFPIKVCIVNDVCSVATYLLKAFWVQRTIFELADGTARRSSTKQRIKGRRHTDMLLWLDRTPLSHLVLTMKLITTKEGFKPS